MSNYLIPKAQNVRTKQVIMSKDLSGRRLAPNQLQEAELIAQRLAQDLTSRTREQWQPFVDTYSV
jgi:hypothetical protein